LDGIGREPGPIGRGSFSINARALRAASSATTWPARASLRASSSFQKFLIREGVASLRDVEPKHLTAFTIERAASRLGKSALGMQCTCLRVFLRYAYREGAVPRDLSAVLAPRSPTD
jgi:site-specific recombinase XerD